MTDRSRCTEIEQSIRTEFHKGILTPFKKAVADYRLVNSGDKIAVCISGGKDSMLMAKLFQELSRRSEVDFEAVFLVMDPGYSPRNLENIKRNAELLEIPAVYFETDIFNHVNEARSNPCALCAKMRRGSLYSKAKELGCSKIALGHHFDDVIESILMGMIYGGQVQTMLPRLKSANFEGMELIRPLYLIREAEVKRWAEYNGLEFIRCACRFTAESADKGSSKRQEIKELIAELTKKNPQIEKNIFRSVENVNLKSIVSYKDKNGEVHSFLDDFDDI